ncbi:uncharacterized protein VTP21DRAFT_5150 [Calcarisporiella thermophila]|uniref:uncharacterized protein n=1 Tax=Calcarisporiella thermophila TaxID=911321 RepID=UPI003741F229
MSENEKSPASTPTESPASSGTESQGSQQSKSKNAEKNEAKRQAKLAKFAAKQAALAAAKAQSNDKSEKKDKKDKKDKKAKEQEFVDNTPPGEKKDLSQPMASGYNPKAVESAWYAWWEKEGFFLPEMGPDGKPKEEGTFVVAMPPPNVTGSLHIGHALTCAIQDALTRWHRMCGKTVLLNPGIDHAGISCQSVVEKRLWVEKKQTRHDIGREAFIQEVWKWKERYGNHIYMQLRRMGVSCDWSRAAFTMDPNLCEAVIEAFCRLHEEGIIYRANRLVNWCVRLNTALSNLEVENKEIPGKTLLSVPGYDPKEKFEFGVLVQFAYPIEGSDEKIVVATTRVETMLGDTAVAIHPNDPRYKHLHGKFIVHPFNGRRIPIITDDIAVDMEFGTGAVKITPAHDFNDYEVGRRHNLPFINIYNDDGTLNANGAPFEGMKRFHVRVKVIEMLKEKGLFVGIKENPMTIPVCSKSGDVIEPLMKPQWWLDCKKMAEDGITAVRNGDLEIKPRTSEQDWFRWLGNIQDWCISRQLWWGHRVPAYFVRLDDFEGEQDASDGQFWVSGHNEEEAHKKASEKFPGKKFTLEQDPDVLDTWFSSGLWPFSILGWPKQTADLESFFPTTLLETGWDILFFWVARMVMFSLKLTGKVPFREIFTHAMIRDAHGRKMSKSLGNVIDPIDVIEGISLEQLHEKLLQGNLDPREIQKAKAGQKADFPKGIPECGTDALRFALCAYTATSLNINLDILRVEGYRKFCNKLWNATRFALMRLGEKFEPLPAAGLTGRESLVERWVLAKLNRAVKETNRALSEKNFMAATSAIHGFWMYNLCDVFVEAIKPLTLPDTPDADPAKRSAQDTLYTCLEAGLKLLHPFMPYLTEELYQRLHRRPQDTIPTIMRAAYPQVVSEYDNAEAEQDFDLVFEGVKSARSLMTQHNKLKATVFVSTKNERFAELFRSQATIIQSLVKGCEKYEVVSEEKAGCVSAPLNEEVAVLLQIE